MCSTEPWLLCVCQAKGILKWVRFKAYPAGIYSCAVVVHNRLWVTARSSYTCNAATHSLTDSAGQDVTELKLRKKTCELSLKLTKVYSR